MGSIEIDEEELLEEMSDNKLLRALFRKVGTKKRLQELLDNYELDFEGFGQYDVDFLLYEQDNCEFEQFANELAWKATPEQKNILLKELKKYS